MATHKKKTNGATEPQAKIRKRTLRKKVETAGPLWQNGELYFSPFDLTRYQLAEHRLANTLQGVALKKHELIAEGVRHESETKRLQFEIAALTAESKKLHEALDALRTELQDGYPVKFEDITFDDQTGRIMIHGEAVKGEQHG